MMNETRVQIGSLDLNLRADFKTIRAIERASQKTVARISMDVSQGIGIDFETMKTILISGARAAGNPVNPEEVEESLMSAGSVRASLEIMKLISIAFKGHKGGNEEAEKKPQT